MAHLLVEWLNEGNLRQFSVVPVLSLCDGELRTKGKELVGKAASFQWKKSECVGKVIQAGDKMELEALADEMAERESQEVQSKFVVPFQKHSSSVKGQRKAKQKGQQIENISSVLQSLDMDIPEPHFIPSQTQDLLLRTDNEDGYKDKYVRLKEKYRTLKTKYKNLKNQQSSDDYIELAPDSNVRILKTELEAMRLLSSRPAVFARNLFRALFSSQELRSHSLFGKKCNANKHHLPLPEIDCVRRDAVIAYVVNTAEVPLNAADQVLRNYKKIMKREVTKSLTDFLREESRKALTM